MAYKNLILDDLCDCKLENDGEDFEIRNYRILKSNITYIKEAIKTLKNNEQTRKDFDPVNHPSHYTSEKVECIDAMEQVFGIEAVKAFCLCNAFKYHWRAKDKNGEEDLKKADWYMNKYKELVNR